MLRPLWELEKYYLARNKLRYYTNVTVSAAYSRLVDAATLSWALRQLILENPIFACSERDGHLELVESIRFNDVASFVDIEAFDDAVLASIDEIFLPIDGHSPLWQVQVFRTPASTYIAFTFDHFLFDGLSGVNFHRDLTKHLLEYPGSGAVDVLFTNGDAVPPLPPTPDKLLLVYTPTLWYTITTLFDHFIWSGVRTRLDAWLGRKPIYSYPIQPPPRTDYCILKVPPKKLARLLQVCREKSLTLTPAVAAICLEALYKEVFPRIKDTPVLARVVTAINGRRFYPDTDNKYGVHVAANNTVIDRALVISNARLLGEALRKDLSSKKLFQSVGMLKYVDCTEYFQGFLGTSTRPTTLEHSNLGHHTIELGEWRVTDLYFHQSTGVQVHFDASTASTPDGGMNVCFGYRHDYADYMHSYREAFTKELEEFLES